MNSISYGFFIAPFTKEQTPVLLSHAICPQDGISTSFPLEFVQFLWVERLLGADRCAVHR